MKIFLFIFLTIFLVGPVYSAPVKTTGIVQQVKTRTPQQEAELRDWIIGIQKLAQEAQVQAEQAEKEANESRSKLVSAESSLEQVNKNADILQKSIDAQAAQLTNAIIEKEKAEKHDKETTKKNNFLKNILGIEAAFIALFLCLWLRVPALSPPVGIIVTVSSPLVVFGLVKLIL